MPVMSDSLGNYELKNIETRQGPGEGGMSFQRMRMCLLFHYRIFRFFRYSSPSFQRRGSRR